MTDKLRAAAQQALEAMQSAAQYHGVVLTSDPPRDAWKYHGVDNKLNSAAQNLRAALAEQPAEQEPFGYFNNPALDGWQDCSPDDEGAIALYEAPQPVKQPLTDEEIIRAAISTQSAEPGRDGYVLPVTFSRAVIAAYEAKNGITGETK